MDFKNIPNKYRPIPFWSWNEKLSVEETKRQIEMMHDVGIGGYFMHARGGLQTDFMGEEWFENISCAIDEGKKLGMDAWAYDENGWPSGFGGGKVNGKGEKFQQKYLRMEQGEKGVSYKICNVNGFHFYYEVNPFYIDILDGEVVADFINEIYEPYYKKYKNDIKGFFTDEPQISRNGIPWSLKLPREYRKAYGEDLLPHLKELFCEEGDYKNTRIKFWKLITDLFSKNYMKQIYDWCVARDLEFTGHLVLEETLETQLTSNGAVMPQYEFFTIPGMDWLGRYVFDCLTVYQLSSAAQQLGKKQVLSETFALCGHNVSFEELKRIYEWQMVRGVNLLCQHLEGYSLRGIRKRDYPPAMYYQQPWWEEYKQFIDSVSRIGMMLTEGEASADILLIHPQTTAWSLFDNEENKGLKELDQQLLDTIKVLEQKHIHFHLGDEIIIERHAKVDGNCIAIGNMRYNTVIMLPDTIVLDSTKRLLEEYEQQGGKFASVEEIAENDIIDNQNVTYTKRTFDGFTMHYFVNSTMNVQPAYIKEGAKYMDIATGDILPFEGSYEFAPFDSLVVIDDGSLRACPERKTPSDIIKTDGKWNIVSQTPNVLTLDRCNYFFDGKLIEENGYVLNIQGRACALKRPVKIKQEFKVSSDILPERLYLVIETPEIFDIFVNGEKVDKADEGHFTDKSFRKIPIAKHFKIGENVITLETMFKQSDIVYENLEKALVFESEKNKLTYDMEIEPIYLLGDFAIKTEGKWKSLDKNACRYSGDFSLTCPAKEAELKNLEKQGYTFFAGKITFEKTVMACNTNQKLIFDKKGLNVIRIEVNGERVGNILWNPTEIDLSKYIKVGENRIRIEIINNLRNMMGPHHLAEGESWTVCPSSFFKEPCVWNPGGTDWNDDYCFVETGLI